MTFAPAFSRLCRWALALTLASVPAMLHPVSADTGDYQGSWFLITELRVSPQEGFGASWTVTHAELRESFSDLRGLVRIENTSAVAMQGSAFYGEYFDAAGDFCYSLVFSQDKNTEGRSGPFRPHEERELYSTAQGVGPAVGPTDLRLYVLGQQPVGAPFQIITPMSRVRTPVTIYAGAPVTASLVRLGPEMRGSQKPAVDVLFATVEVGYNGRAGRVDVLNSESGQLADWFRNRLVKGLGFGPATAGDKASTSRTLVLVRAVVAPKQAWRSAFVPRDSSWVKSYIEDHHGSELPVLQELTLDRPPTLVKRLGSLKTIRIPPAPPGVFEYSAAGTVWCWELFTWEPGGPHKPLRRAWSLWNLAPASR